MNESRILVALDTHNTTEEGLYFDVDYTENWKEYIGEKVFFTGVMEGIYYIKDGGIISGGLYDTKRKLYIIYLVDKV